MHGAASVERYFFYFLFFIIALETVGDNDIIRSERDKYNDRYTSEND